MNQRKGSTIESVGARPIEGGGDALQARAGEGRTGLRGPRPPWNPIPFSLDLIEFGRQRASEHEDDDKDKGDGNGNGDGNGDGHGGGRLGPEWRTVGSCKGATFKERTEPD